jgi:protein tyrosine/serine phosphatase
VLVHCRRGADRTGVMLAIYRVVVEGWTKADAIDEMTRGGYGFRPVWQNLVRYVEELDVEAIRVQVVTKPP